MFYTTNRLFNDFFNNGFYEARRVMNTDIIEGENSYTLEVEIPGYTKEDLSVSLDKGYLTVEAKYSRETEGKYIRQERVMEDLSRTFYVGDYLDESDIQASYTNGILTITLPKYETKKVENRKTICIE